MSNHPFVTGTTDIVDPRNRAAWRTWLKKYHTESRGVWTILHKKQSGTPRLTYEDAVDEALCFGWIDSRLNTLDDNRFKLWFSPRQPKSIWAKNNKERVARLIDQGLIAPAGLATIKAARLDGSWTALDAIDALTIPPDLQQALANNPVAVANFDAFSNSTKKMILRWIDVAKHPETRRKRIDETVRQAAKNLKPHH